MPHIRITTTLKVTVSETLLSKLRGEEDYQPDAFNIRESDPFERFVYANCFRNNTFIIEDITVEGGE
jgi:hypothetical protein